jgi:hypothetical protein
MTVIPPLLLPPSSPTVTLCLPLAEGHPLGRSPSVAVWLALWTPYRNYLRSSPERDQ